MELIVADVLSASQVQAVYPVTLGISIQIAQSAPIATLEMVFSAHLVPW